MDEQEKVKQQIVRAQEETDRDLRTSAQGGSRLAGQISDFTGKAIVNSGEAIFNGISGVNRELDKSQESVKKQIAKANKSTNNTLSRIIADTVFTIGERVQDFSDKTGFAIVDFGYIFVNEPTKIAEVKVIKATSTSATIAWTTNHPANGKVNYGLTADYGEDIQSEKRITYHEFTIRNLKPNTTYYYEVMSHNKNYVYDANHTLVTPAK